MDGKYEKNIPASDKRDQNTTTYEATVNDLGLCVHLVSLVAC